ncbi:MAG: hypothetical protein K2O24_07405 [Muribaculaceae bacterium]|nr:hypothetical protein [Muribaculaceae bacterium]
MSFGFILKKRDGVSRLDIINTIVNRVPDISFVSIEDPYMLLGIKDKSLRGVVVQENDNDWEVMVPSGGSLTDYALFKSVLSAISTNLDLPLLLPESLVESEFEDGEDDEDEDEDEDEFDSDFDSDFGDEDDDFSEDEDEIDEGFGAYSDFDDQEDPLVELSFSEAESHLFYDGWEADNVYREMMMMRTLIGFSGTTAVAQGLFHSFCIGPWLMSQYGISVEPRYEGASESTDRLTDFLNDIRDSSPELAESIVPEAVTFFSRRMTAPFLTDEEKEGALRLMDHLALMQWKYSDCADTSSEARAINPEIHPEIKEGKLKCEDDEDPQSYSKSISAFSSRRLAEGDFPLLVSYADVAAITHSELKEGENTLVIPFDSLPKFMKGTRIDEVQFAIETPLSSEEIEDVMAAVPVFVPRDIFSHPEMPGMGSGDNQKTFILMWNPEISSVTMEDFRKMLAHMRTVSLDWSIYDHSSARIGDRFYLVCCGGKHQGMVASGILSSNPYMGEDWSGRGREVWYADLDLNVMVDPETGDPVSLDELTLAIPDFDWHGGHSGRKLPPEDARKLNEIWHGHLVEWMDRLGIMSPEGRPSVNVLFR